MTIWQNVVAIYVIGMVINMAFMVLIKHLITTKRYITRQDTVNEIAAINKLENHKVNGGKNMLEEKLDEGLTNNEALLGSFVLVFYGRLPLR